MRLDLRWEPPTYKPKERVADVSDVGRYHVRRSGPRVQQWDVRLNGKMIGQCDSAEEAIGFAERDAYAKKKD